MSPRPGNAFPRVPARVRTPLRTALVLVVGALLTVLTPVVPPAGAQSDGRISIDVSSVTPEVVREGSGKTLRISGALYNTGGRPVSDLQMRLERGEPRATRASLVTALRANATTSTRTHFTTVAERIGPGQRSRFELRVELTGNGPDGLGVDRPGVYPLLLNVNGDLAPRRRARVATERFMLPVLSLPGRSATPPEQSTRITTLIPLVDRPHLAQEQLPGRPTILTDDRLATTLAPGGRLFELVRSVSEKAPADSKLGEGICLVIDPDLIVTARAMAGGYQVRGEDDELVAGSGAEAAKRWLDELRDTVRGRCVIALPYSDADVVALTRAGLPDLLRGSLDGGALVERELGVRVREDVLWPADGALDGATASRLADTPVRTVLMHPESLAAPAGSLEPVRVRTDGRDYTPTARLVDPLVADALNPARGQQAGGSTGTAPVGDGTPSVLNGLSALAFRSTVATVDSTTLVAPPRRWDLDGDEVDGFLDGLKALDEAGFVRPVPLPEESAAKRDEGGSPSGTSASAAGDSASPVALTYPGSSARREIPRSVLDDLAAQNYRVGQLFGASEREPALNVDPASVTTPLRNGLLHGASSAWRGNERAAARWVEIAARTVEGVLNGVHIADFDWQITLTSSNSKIPVTVRNDLPVNVRFRLHVDTPPGVRVDDLGVLRVPANGSRPFLPETTVERSGKFTVDVTLRTEGGTKLGQTRRMRVDSNAYGTVPVILTVTGAALLVLLSARRIVRRFRSRGDGGTDPSTPGESEATAEEANPAGPEASSGREIPDGDGPRAADEEAPPAEEPTADGDPRRD
ncbi:DUF6049 family protein [Actinopolyspora mortivallis]|uniref:Glycoprotein n=1 Tax=Actinopolyspora mortivallis TaxID=33906 RepID=A0A2T0GWI2_ACTMO|nr:DUF6049 family protein [Actinopolyspora mortivallis]PRW63468.1 hypothetical protein CEP50_10325 [Actinopolyspora mortivallis]